MESTYKGRFVVSRDHRPGSQTPNAWGPTCTFFTRLHDVTGGGRSPPCRLAPKPCLCHFLGGPSVIPAFAGAGSASKASGEEDNALSEVKAHDVPAQKIEPEKTIDTRARRKRVSQDRELIAIFA